LILVACLLVAYLYVGFPGGRERGGGFGGVVKEGGVEEGEGEGEGEGDAPRVMGTVMGMGESAGGGVLDSVVVSQEQFVREYEELGR
jgi:hypothetical protein